MVKNGLVFEISQKYTFLHLYVIVSLYEELWKLLLIWNFTLILVFGVSEKQIVHRPDAEWTRCLT